MAGGNFPVADRAGGRFPGDDALEITPTGGVQTAGLAFADAAERLQEQRMLLYFHSPRCAPCRRMAPIVEELVAEGRALALDISSAPEIARRFNVRATPTTLLVERGTIVKVLLGFQSRERLRELLN